MNDQEHAETLGLLQMNAVELSRLLGEKRSVGVCASSPLAVGSGQTGRTITTSGWTANKPESEQRTGDETV